MFTAGQVSKFQYSNSEKFYPTTILSNRQAGDDPESVHLWGAAFLLNRRPVLVPKIGTANDRYVSVNGTSSYVRFVVVSGQSGLAALLWETDM